MLKHLLLGHGQEVAYVEVNSPQLLPWQPHGTNEKSMLYAHGNQSWTFSTEESHNCNKNKSTSLICRRCNMISASSEWYHLRSESPYADLLINHERTMNCVWLSFTTFCTFPLCKLFSRKSNNSWKLHARNISIAHWGPPPNSALSFPLCRHKRSMFNVTSRAFKRRFRIIHNANFF